MLKMPRLRVAKMTNPHQIALSLRSFFSSFFAFSLRISLSLSVFFTSNNRISHRSSVKSYSADRIIVTRNNEINVIWVRVSINDTDYWNTKVLSFFDCNRFVVNVDDEQCVRYTTHGLNTAKCTFTFLHITSTL